MDLGFQPQMPDDDLDETELVKVLQTTANARLNSISQSKKYLHHRRSSSQAILEQFTNETKTTPRVSQRRLSHPDLQNASPGGSLDQGQLQAAIYDVQKQLSRLHSAADTRDKELQEVRQELEETRDQLRFVRRELRSSEEAHKETKLELTKAREELDIVERKLKAALFLAEKRKNDISPSPQLEDLQRRLDAALALADQRGEELTARKSEEKQLRGELVRLKAEEAELRDSQRRKDQEIRELRERERTSTMSSNLEDLPRLSAQSLPGFSPLMSTDSINGQVVLPPPPPPSPPPEEEESFDFVAEMPDPTYKPPLPRGLSMNPEPPPLPAGLNRVVRRINVGDDGANPKSNLTPPTMEELTKHKRKISDNPAPPPIDKLPPHMSRPQTPTARLNGREGSMASGGTATVSASSLEDFPQVGRLGRSSTVTTQPEVVSTKPPGGFVRSATTANLGLSEGQKKSSFPFSSPLLGRKLSPQPADSKPRSSKPSSNSSSEPNSQQSSKTRFFSLNGSPSPRSPSRTPSGKSPRTPRRSQPLTCNKCGKENPRFSCQGCKRVDYCSETCQRSDWKTHREQCGQNKDKDKQRDSDKDRPRDSQGNADKKESEKDRLKREKEKEKEERRLAKQKQKDLEKQAKLEKERQKEEERELKAQRKREKEIEKQRSKLDKAQTVSDVPRPVTAATAAARERQALKLHHMDKLTTAIQQLDSNPSAWSASELNRAINNALVVLSQTDPIMEQAQACLSTHSYKYEETDQSARAGSDGRYAMGSIDEHAMVPDPPPDDLPEVPISPPRSALGGSMRMMYPSSMDNSLDPSVSGISTGSSRDPMPAWAHGGDRMLSPVPFGSQSDTDRDTPTRMSFDHTPVLTYYDHEKMGTSGRHWESDSEQGESVEVVGLTENKSPALPARALLSSSKPSLSPILPPSLPPSDPIPVAVTIPPRLSSKYSPGVSPGLSPKGSRKGSPRMSTDSLFTSPRGTLVTDGVLPRSSMGIPEGRLELPPPLPGHLEHPPSPSKNLCEECEDPLNPPDVYCALCEQHVCVACDARVHAKGKLQLHQRVALTETAQVTLRATGHEASQKRPAAPASNAMKNKILFFNGGS